MKKHLVLSGLLACGLFACGSFDGQTDKPTTLATIRGELSNTSGVATSSNVRVAIVWLNGTTYSVAEDLPVQPKFPSAFELSLTAPPPAEAMFPAKIANGGSADLQAAYGFVVAYEDQNGNGKLDLVQNDQHTFIDKIVGTNRTLGLFYLAGTASQSSGTSASAGSIPSPGYNFVTVTACTDAPCDDGFRTQFSSLSTPYDLELTSDPEVNQLMCLNYGKGSASASGSNIPDWNVAQQGTPAGGYPLPGSPSLSCIQDGYTVQDCTEISTGLCEEHIDCHVKTVVLGGAAKPAGWPCQ